MHTRFWLATGAAIALALGVAVTAASADDSTTPPPKPAPAQVPDAAPKFGDYVYVEVLPEVVRRVDPIVPDLGVHTGVSGTVVVQAFVGVDGLVHDTKVTKSIPMLDAAAVDCVRQWTFKPAFANQRPVAVWVAVPVRFPSGDGSTAAVPAELQAPATPAAPVAPPNPTFDVRISRVERPLRPRVPANLPVTKEHATVMVNALVGDDGHVREARVASAASTLDAAALDAVRGATFRAPTRDGRATTGWVRVPVRFRK